MALSREQIIKQSESALGQWGKQWLEHAKEHSKYEQKPLSDFQNIGVGKTLLICANGYSLEENIETIKENRAHVDILACDKTLKNLIDHGITPNYCMVCDANVNYETYLEPIKDKVSSVVLFMNACGNPLWTKEAWGDRYFFVNKDAIKSEGQFSKASGCTNFIAAGTNVSGAMVVLATQCDNNGRNNFFGYDKILCIGFDHSWRPGGKYYAFNESGDGKNSYMRHLHLVDRAGEDCFSSSNLHFSANWLRDYVVNFRLPVLLASPHTIVGGIPTVELKDHIAYSYRPEDGPKVRNMLSELNQVRLKLKNLESTISDIGQKHWVNYSESI